MISVAPNQFDIHTALRAFLLLIVPAGVEVIKGQVNRVPEPQAEDFVVFWVLRRERLATNIDLYADCRFVGSIAGTVLTVTEIAFGTLAVGRQLFGVGVLANTTIAALSSGTGGVGTYVVNLSQTLASEVLATGAETMMQETDVVTQLDVHGPNSADNAQIISTLFRDDYAYDGFSTGQAPGPISITPLYADDPRQIPFLNAEQQYEDRYVIEAHMQADQVVGVPLQFADAAVVGLINVDVVYPP